VTVAGQGFANRLIAPRAEQEVEAKILKATTLLIVNGSLLSKNQWKKRVCVNIRSTNNY